jgi:hypothetical protein
MKRKTPIRRASKKRELELKIYYSLKKYILSQRPYCQIPSANGTPCLNRATGIHHVKGRAGELLCDVRFWLAVCPQCHDYIHAHAKESRARGLMKF